MKEVKEDFGKFFFEETINDMRKNGADTNEFARPLYNGILHAYELYKKYCPYDKLKTGIELIKQDPYFKEPEAIKSEAGRMDIKEFWRKFNFLIWESRVLKKFVLYGFLRANLEVIKQNITNQNGENKILLNHVFLMGIYSIYKAGTTNYASLTANSVDQKLAPSLKIPSIEPLIAAFEPHLKTIERASKSGKIAGWNEEKTLQFQTYLFAMDMDAFQQDIFKDLQDSFEVTKQNSKGEQSERYKILLLWNLFKHTHPQLYHTTGSPDGNRTQDDLNAEALRKIIAKPGSDFFD